MNIANFLLLAIFVQMNPAEDKTFKAKMWRLFAVVYIVMTVVTDVVKITIACIG